MHILFVHHFIRIIVPAIFVSVIAAKAAQKPADFFSKKKMNLVKELDEVMREMVWLIRSERPSANKTLFGKVYRALQQAKGGKLTEKNKHTCDQYKLEKVSEYQYRVYEYCQKHRSPDLLAKIDWSERRATFQFQGQNYVDILGGAAALVAPVIDCTVTIESESRLSELHCTGFRITRAENVVRFASIGYKKGKDPMIVMKGEVLKNLLPYSDLTISVPLAGKVHVLEKKKVPDSDELAKKPPTMPAPVDPRKSPENFEPVYVDPAKATLPPREGESPNDSESTQQNPNNTLLKNSQPDVIEIQENQPIPQPLPTR